MDSWQKELRTQASQGIKIFLIGNKADLEDQRVISKEQGEKMKNDYGFDLFMETSAKTGYNAQELFFQAGKILFEENDRIQRPQSISHEQIKKGFDKKNNAKKKCC